MLYRTDDREEERCPNCGQVTGGESLCPNCGTVLPDQDDELEGFHEEGDDIVDEE